MDFLSGNFDRHVGNVMVSNKGLLAIDNAYGFQYKYDHMNGPDAPRQKEPTQDNFEHYFKGKGTHQASGVGPAPSPPTKADYDKAPPSEHRKMTNDYIQARNQYDESMHQAFAPTFEWWKQASPNVRATMDKYLKHIVDKPTREHIKANFNARADWLDAHAQGGLLSHDKTWSTDPVAHHLPYQFYEKPAPAPPRQYNDAAPYQMIRS